MMGSFALADKLAYLSLGSNLGDRHGYLKTALDRLKRCAGVTIQALSGLYETEPQDFTDQPWFLNMVAAVSTNLLPQELLAAVQGIENAAGRVRREDVPRGPRTLDIDVLLFGMEVIETSDLVVPHPRMLVRRFVLEPLLEIAPDLQLPPSGQPVAEYLRAVRDQPVRYAGPL